MKATCSFNLLLLLILILPYYGKGQVIDTVCINSTGSHYLATGEYGSTYQWWVQGPQNSFTPSTDTSLTVNWGSIPGHYEIKVLQTSIDGCKGDTVRGFVWVVPMPNPNLGADTQFICNPQFTTLSTSVSYSSYLWSTGATTQNLSPGGYGNYSVTVTDIFGCIGTANSTIEPGPPAYSLSFSTNIPSCTGFSDGQIQALVSGANPPVSYLWNTGAITPTLNGIPAGSYEVTVVDLSGCSLPGSIILVDPPPLGVSATVTQLPCNGQALGTISLSASGGTPPYTFLWEPNGATTATLTGLSAGAYSCTISCSTGCSTTGSWTINPPLSGTLTPTAVLCNGTQTGQLNLTLSGGSPPYSFAWFSGQTTEDLLNIGTGTYLATITDSQGCVIYRSTVINQPPAINIISSSINVSCSGGTNGSITVFASGGTAPLSYLWSQGATIPSPGSLPGGVYTLTITDGNGCQKVHTKTITEPPALANSFTVTPVPCNSGSNGSILQTVSGGTAPYSFLWSTGATTQNLASLSAGNYTLTITDFKACKLFPAYSITQPPALAGTTTTISPSCYGWFTGAINLNMVGGTPPYAFLWNSGSSLEDLSSLAAGTYTVTTTDSQGCSQVLVTTLTQPPQILPQAVIHHITCKGLNNGAIDLTPIGGTPPLTTAWSNGVTSEDISGLSPGTYLLEISDASGCTSFQTYSISEPSSLSVTAIATNILCFGATTGSILATTTGGVGPYGFNWSNGATQFFATGLGAGTYNLTVHDANNCLFTNIYTLTQPATPLSVTATPTSIVCFGTPTGSISLVASGGSPGYSFLWNNGLTVQNPSALIAGNYAVTVTDTHNCKAQTQLSINQPAFPVTASPVISPLSCNGVPGGSININPSGGTPPYIFSWSNGSTSEDISSLLAGPYMLSVQDANNCPYVFTFLVSQPTLMILSAIPAHVLCNGGASGGINLSVMGGTPGYAYVWNSGATTQDLSGIPAGNYIVTVTDANLCKGVYQTTISQPPVLLATTTISDVNCYGSNSGSIDLNVTGGTSPYHYLWSNGSTTQDQATISAGNYTVTVFDSNNCVALAFSLVHQPDQALGITLTPVHVSCFGMADGAILNAVSGGTVPYTFLWSNGMTTQVVGALGPGNFSVTVTDLHNCIQTAATTLTQPPAITMTWNVVQVTCFGFLDGFIDLNMTGGLNPFTYQWSNGAGSEDLSNLGAGLYTVTVTDLINCQRIQTFDIVQPEAPLSATTLSDTVLCPWDQNGGIDLTVSGGSSPYFYLWNNGNISEDLTTIGSGVYTVTITDQNGCTLRYSTTVPGPPPLVVSITPAFTYSGFPVPCFQNQNGVLGVVATGGTMPYNYLWNTGSQQSQIDSVSAGFYALTLTDAHQCTILDTLTVLQPPPLIGTASITPANCPEIFTGGIQIFTTGGVAPYLYQWTTGDQGDAINNLQAGQYTVTISDSNGCPAILVLEVENEFNECILVPTAITPNGDGFNDEWKIRGIEYYPEAIAEIYNRWGQLLFKSDKGYHTRWNGTYDGIDLPSEAYYFVLNLNNGSKTLIGTVTIIR